MTSSRPGATWWRVCYQRGLPSLVSTIAQSDDSPTVKLDEDGLQESCNSGAAQEGAKFVLASEIRDGRRLQEITPTVAGREARVGNRSAVDKATE